MKLFAKKLTNKKRKSGTWLIHLKMCRFRNCFRAKTSERPLRSIRMCETIFMSHLSTKNTDIITRHGVYFTTVTDLHKAQKQRLKYIRSFFFGGYMWIWVLEEKQLAELHGHHSSIFLTSFNCVIKGLVVSRDQTYSQCKLLYLFSWRIADETWNKNVLDVG